MGTWSITGSRTNKKSIVHKRETKYTEVQRQVQVERSQKDLLEKKSSTSFIIPTN